MPRKLPQVNILASDGRRDSYDERRSTRGSHAADAEGDATLDHEEQPDTGSGRSSVHSAGSAGSIGRTLPAVPLLVVHPPVDVDAEANEDYANQGGDNASEVFLDNDDGNASEAYPDGEGMTGAGLLGASFNGSLAPSSLAEDEVPVTPDGSTTGRDYATGDHGRSGGDVWEGEGHDDAHNALDAGEHAQGQPEADRLEREEDRVASDVQPSDNEADGTAAEGAEDGDGSHAQPVASVGTMTAPRS